MTPGGQGLATLLSGGERAVGRVKAASPPMARSSPERVLDGTRKIHRLESRVYTDATNFQPFGLHPSQIDYEERLKNISKFFHSRCVSLDISMQLYHKKSDFGFHKMDCEGQAFIVKIAQEMFIVTVKHNLCSEVNKEGFFEKCVFVHFSFPGMSRCFVFPFSECEDGLLGWDADSSQDKFEPTEWKYGNELLMIPLCEKYVNTFKNVYARFEFLEAVSKTFEVKENMEVGIMAHSNTDLLAQSMQSQLQDAGEEYKAKKGDIFITVGKITYVGNEHIEYDANTVCGFSGAPVFLLSAGTDYAEQHMKVIAVHAGNTKTSGDNFGFLVSPKIQTAAASGAADEHMEDLQYK